ncbi:MAG: type II CAAX endopeptidase family protein [Chloroflexota bacterium]
MISLRSFLSRALFSPDERRLRAGWRLLAQAFLLLFLAVALLLPFLLLSMFGISFPGSDLLSQELATLFAVTISVYLARRFIDRRSFASLGLQLRPRAGLDILVGLVIGGLMMTSIYLLEWSAGWLTFQGFAWSEGTIASVMLQTAQMLVAFILAGWQEELISRGYHLQNLAEGLNLPWGWVLSSLVFALLHLANPGATLLSTLGILAAGLFLGYAYLATRQLWLPIGIHIGWNFFEGVVFGYPVSGYHVFHLISQQVNGPALFTGGDFGPEAGLVLLPALLLGSGLIYLYAHSKYTRVVK